MGGSMATSGTIPGSPIQSTRDIGFAIGIVTILTVLFLPLPAIMIDIGLGVLHRASPC